MRTLDMEKEYTCVRTTQSLQKWNDEWNLDLEEFKKDWWTEERIQDWFNQFVIATTEKDLK